MAQFTELRRRLADRPAAEQAAELARIADALKRALQDRGERVGEADAAIEAMRREARGEAVSGTEVSTLIYSDRETGVLRRLADAQGQPSEPLWNALTTATMYAAWLAYRASGQAMPEDVAEVDASTLDLLEEQLGAAGLHADA